MVPRIVVEDGKTYVGQTVEVMVTSILQTSAGRNDLLLV